MKKIQIVQKMHSQKPQIWLVHKIDLSTLLILIQNLDGWSFE